MAADLAASIVDAQQKASAIDRRQGSQVTPDQQRILLRHVQGMLRVLYECACPVST